MCSQEEQKWANSTEQELESIAKNWSKKYNTKQMRKFQNTYNEWLEDSPALTESELKGELTDNSIFHMALLNRHKAMSRAIDIKEFRKD
jgi:hypothetical protein